MYSHCTVIHSHKLLGLDGSEYGMVGNFRGALIFVIFVVDLAVTKFSHPRKLMPTVICESMVMGVTINIHCGSAANTSQYISKQHFYSADSIFDTKILLSHAVCPRYGLVTKKIASEIASACIDYIIPCAAVPRPWTGCCHGI